MALCRLEAKIISRRGGRGVVGAASYRSGRCATSAAAYRAGAELTDERTGLTFDYTRKRGVEGAAILLPDGAPAWMSDRGQLWNAVEKAEKRSDAQLARDYILTLPHELDAAQRDALTRQFVQREFVDRGYAADIAWHGPHGKGDERNHHAHVMVAMRQIDGDGFARTKERAPEGKHPAEHWKAELLRQREAWAEAGADALHTAGFAREAERFRAGHLPLAQQQAAATARGDTVWAQQLDREAEPKQGPLATQMEREGRASHAGDDRREVQARNATRAQLKAEHAQIEAEIIDLEAARAGRAGMSGNEKHGGGGAVERESGGNGMRGDAPALNEAAFARQPQREAEQLRQLREQDAKLEVWKRDQAQQAEAARRQEQEREKEGQKHGARGGNDGDTADAGTRYSQALGQHYDMRDPYGSLARAAMSEWASFKKEQDTLRRDAAAEKDPGKRRQIELRREIEGCDYMVITSERLARGAEARAPRRDSPIAQEDRARADTYRVHGQQLRQERTREAEIIQRRQAEETKQREGLRPDQPAETAPGTKEAREMTAREKALAAYAQARSGTHAAPAKEVDTGRQASRPPEKGGGRGR